MINVLKANPYHDALGRFTSAQYAVSASTTNSWDKTASVDLAHKHRELVYAATNNSAELKYGLLTDTSTEAANRINAAIKSRVQLQVDGKDISEKSKLTAYSDTEDYLYSARKDIEELDGVTRKTHTAALAVIQAGYAAGVTGLVSVDDITTMPTFQDLQTYISNVDPDISSKLGLLVEHAFRAGSSEYARKYHSALEEAKASSNSKSKNSSVLDGGLNIEYDPRNWGVDSFATPVTTSNFDVEGQISYLSRALGGKPDWVDYGYVPESSLKSTANEALSNASRDAVLTIRDYTGNYHSEINKYLVEVEAGNKSMPSHILMSVNDLDSVLSQTRVGADIVTKRVMREDVFTRTMGPLNDDLVGKVYREPAYSSSSVDLFSSHANYKSNSKPFDLIIRVPKEAHGVYVESVSSVSKENELLLPRGSLYKVSSVGKSPTGKGYAVVDLIGVSSKPIDKQNKKS